jgi:NADH-quinone oxidoreductase subunit G
MAEAGRASRMAVILTSFLTNEELESCRELFVNILGVGQVFFADPKPGEADGYLLTAERAPNSRGAAALGFTPKLPDLEGLAASADLLLVFGPHLLGHFAAGEIEASFQKIGRKYLLAAHRSALDSMVDIVLPTALPAEKKGSFTNVGGVTQSFERAVRAPRGCRPEGEILTSLASALGVERG